MRFAARSLFSKHQHLKRKRLWDASESHYDCALRFSLASFFTLLPFQSLSPLFCLCPSYWWFFLSLLAVINISINSWRGRGLGCCCCCWCRRWNNFYLSDLSCAQQHPDCSFSFSFFYSYFFYFSRSTFTVFLSSSSWDIIVSCHVGVVFKIVVKDVCLSVCVCLPWRV